MCAAPHWPNVGFKEAHGFAIVGEHHHIMRTVGNRYADQIIVFVQRDGNDAAGART